MTPQWNTLITDVPHWGLVTLNTPKWSSVKFKDVQIDNVPWNRWNLSKIHLQGYPLGLNPFKCWMHDSKAPAMAANHFVNILHPVRPGNIFGFSLPNFWCQHIPNRMKMRNTWQLQCCTYFFQHAPFFPLPLVNLQCGQTCCNCDYTNC